MVAVSKQRFHKTKFDVSCFESFYKHFPYRCNGLYQAIYRQNQSTIKIKKAHVAVANLKKIFPATFKLSAKLGFHEMTVRDLANETGISMGSIYSCIGKKEYMAVMVKNLLSEVLQKNLQLAQDQADCWSKLETIVRLQFYTSCALQQWLFFLYFETRILPQQHQLQAKQIELSTIENYQAIIEQGRILNQFETDDDFFVAQTILLLLQDWYLKPWKYKLLKLDREVYLANLLSKLKTLLSHQ